MMSLKCKKCGEDAPDTQSLKKSWHITGRANKQGKAKRVRIEIYKCMTCGKQWRQGITEED